MWSFLYREQRDTNGCDPLELNGTPHVHASATYRVIVTGYNIQGVWNGIYVMSSGM